MPDIFGELNDKPDDTFSEMKHKHPLEFHQDPPPRPARLWATGLVLVVVVFVSGVFLLNTSFGQPLTFFSLVLGLLSAIMGLFYVGRAAEFRRHYIYILQQEALDVISSTDRKKLDLTVFKIIDKLLETGAYREAAQIRSALRGQGGVDAEYDE